LVNGSQGEVHQVAIGARGADVYRRTEVQSSSPVGLVVMLYDGALRFINEAREAIARQDVRARTTAVSKTLAIIAELQNTLNMREGGEVAAELDRLYSYMSTRLLDVTAKSDVTAANEVHKLLTTLRDGWSQVAAAGPIARP
jgi:flagellar secretion chaperone FliS